jgi:hypothetical protein
MRRAIALLALPAPLVAYTTPSVPLKGCIDASCPQNTHPRFSDEANCSLGGDLLRKVGIAPSVVNIPGTDTNLSLTVATVNDAPIVVGWADKQVFTQSFYVGKPAGFNLSSTPVLRGCSLILQHFFQTLPIHDVGLDNETSSCGPWMSVECMETLGEFVRDFNRDTLANPPDESQQPDPMCQRLALYIEERSRQKQFHCGLIPGAINITGAEMAGPGAPMRLARDLDVENNCNPVLPSDYELVKLADVGLILNLNKKDQAFGGLDGYTPVMSAMLGTNATTEFICIKTMNQFERRMNAAAHLIRPLSLPYMLLGLVLAATLWELVN